MGDAVDRDALRACLPGIYRAVQDVPLAGPFRVSGGMYAVETDAGIVLIDPFKLANLAALETLGAPEAVVLCGSNHVRDVVFYRSRYGAKIYVHRDLMGRIGVGVDVFFDTGDVLPGGLQAIGMPGTFRGETVLFGNQHGGFLIAGDAFYNLQPPDFKVPGMRAVGFRKGLNTMPRAFIQERGYASYRRLLDYSFDALLMSHGDPLLSGARDRVRALVESLTPNLLSRFKR